ncbi:MAG: VWA domain-containing protein [Acidilobaceae archaeon]
MANEVLVRTNASYKITIEPIKMLESHPLTVYYILMRALKQHAKDLIEELKKREYYLTVPKDQEDKLRETKEKRDLDLEWRTKISDVIRSHKLIRALYNLLEEKRSKTEVEEKAEENEREIPLVYKSQQSWKYYLRGALLQLSYPIVQTDWRLPNRRFGDELPAIVMRPVEPPDVAVLIDISGNVSEKELFEFLSDMRELVHQVRIKNVKVIAWDTEVREVFDIDEYEDKVKTTGSGDTRIDDALK